MSEPEMLKVRESAVSHVSGDTVRVSQSRVDVLHATQAELQQATIRQAQAEHLQARQSVIVSLRADQASLEASSIVYAQAGALSVHNGQVLAAQADQVQIQGGHVGLLIAGRVEGEVQVLLSWREAAIAGLIAGTVSAILYVLWRAITPKT